jgi:hypothetical protein
VPGAGELAEHLDDPSLADQVVEAFRAHPGGQRSGGFLPSGDLKELALIPHVKILTQE